MSLRFIVGRSGSGKSTLQLNEVRDRLMQNPTGSPIIYLVPDQMTFQVEYQLINTPGISGLIRAQVFSFTRLAWRILQETEGFARFHLDSVGLHMLLRKIIEHRKDELKVFTRAAEQKGFVKQLEEMIAEFKRYCVTPESLEEKRLELNDHRKDTNKEVLLDKLFDFQLIFQDYERYLITKYVDSEDYLRLLASTIPKSNELKDAEVYIDGFHSFTPQELEVLNQLLKTCKRVTIGLTIDPHSVGETVHELNLFQMTNKTYNQLYSIAKDNNIEIEDIVTLEETLRFKTSPSLSHLEAHYDSRPTKAFAEEDVKIKLLGTVNRRAEVEGVAREMLRLVREESYRWRDFAILLRNGLAIIIY